LRTLSVVKNIEIVNKMDLSRKNGKSQLVKNLKMKKVKLIYYKLSNEFKSESSRVTWFSY